MINKWGRLADLAWQAASGRLEVPIDTEYPFADAPRAVAHYAREHIRGKVVISL